MTDKIDINKHQKLSGSTCSRCSGKNLVQTQPFSLRPLSGLIICADCSHRESIYAFVANQIVSVQTMPTGALPFYFDHCFDQKNEDHKPNCAWWHDWHACDCGKFNQ